jgi:hypothetical protein
MERPAQDTSPYFTPQHAEFVFKGHHLLGRGLVVEKLLNEPNATGKRA